MDGAMGTQLQEAGLPDGACPELWNLSQRKHVLAVHRAYVAAGARCLVGNTFQANPVALARHGWAEHLGAIQRAALNLARSACGPDHFVLGDIGPIGDPASGKEFADPAVTRQTADGLQNADGLLVETCSSPVALDAARALGSEGRLPVLLSLTYRKSDRGRLLTASGHPPEWFACRAGKHGVAALGVNCGRDIGMDDILEIVRRYRAETDLPLLARPNAGTPSRVDGRWVYPCTPEEMAARLLELLEAGVSLVGGCCGTTPGHIAAFRPVVEEWNRQHAVADQPAG
jgi:5-methyltetrahydrofolate--homocysteine methyltransferase